MKSKYKPRNPFNSEYERVSTIQDYENDIAALHRMASRTADPEARTSYYRLMAILSEWIKHLHTANDLQ